MMHPQGINCKRISLFILCLNSSMRGHSLYPLSLTALLNFCTNSSIILFPCSSFHSSATFINSSSLLPNSFFMSVKNSPIISYSSNSPSRSSNTFSFQMSTDPPCIYNSTHWIYSSTDTPLIFMYIYSLYTVMNLATFLELPLNSYGFATSTYILGCTNAATPSAPPNLAWVIIVCSTASYSCWCCVDSWYRVVVVMVWLVVMMMIMQVVGLGVVTVLELKELILYWTQFLTCILFTKSL